MPRILFGKLMPKPEDKEDKKKKAPKKAPGKKDGAPKRVIKWADGPPRDVPTTMTHMARAK